MRLVREKDILDDFTMYFYIWQYSSMLAYLMLVSARNRIIIRVHASSVMKKQRNLDFMVAPKEGHLRKKKLHVPVGTEVLTIQLNIVTLVVRSQKVPIWKV